jgi:hypothetical protein
MKIFPVALLFIVPYAIGGVQVTSAEPAVHAAIDRLADQVDQIKAATRAGMGPCQGRQCGYTVTRILSTAQNRAPSEVGFFHIRPPLKPVTLGELASLDQPATS